MDKKQFNKKKREYGPRINEKIRIPQIRVINEDGKMLGIMSPKEALAIAKQYGLDLVEVVANARPPVCKIIEYGKYKYEQSKKQNKQQSRWKDGPSTSFLVQGRAYFLLSAYQLVLYM